MSIGKARRAIATNGCCDHITVKSDVVQTTEERNQVTFGCRSVVVNAIFVGLTAQRCFVVGCLIETRTFAVVGVIEMLPFITCHDVEVMLFVEIFVVLRIGIERKIVFRLVFPAFPAVVVVAIRPWSDGVALFTIRIVGTEVGVQAQVFKSVNFVIGFQVTNKRARISTIFLCFERCKWVGSGLRIVHIGVFWVVVGRSRFYALLPITTKLVTVCVVVNLVSRIHRKSSTNHATVGIAVVDVHTFGVQVERQMVIQE